MTRRALAGFGSVRQYAPRVEPGAGCDLQWLANYLNQELGDDPYDVAWAVPGFLEEREIEYDVEDEVGSAEKLVELMADDPKLKRAWRKYVDEFDVLQADPGVPYVHFYNARVQPRAQWYWHFTRAGHFSGFTRGATLEELAFTTDRNVSRATGSRAAPADCMKNLTGELGPMESIFSFAVPDDYYSERQLRHSIARKYGDYGVLFQSDCAVTVEHKGDEERQAIFLTCSDYNNVPFTIDRGTGVITAEFGDMAEEQEFESFESLLTAVKAFLAKPEAPVTARALGEAGTMRRKWLGKLPGRSRR